MICLYCGKPGKYSISHIIPEALGKGPTLDTGVCESCNHTINTEVENPVISALSQLRNFIGLGDKRGKRASIHAEARFGQKTMKFSFTDPEELKNKTFVFENAKDSEGVEKKITIISLDRAAVEKRRAQYKVKHPDTDFKEIGPDIINSGLEYWLFFDLAIFADPKCLRMVAKIALEWWIKKRRLESQQLPEYKEIVDYVSKGTLPQYPIVSIMMEPRLFSYIAPVPFPMHTFVISIDPRSTNLVILYGLFSIVYYKVIITRRHHSFAVDDSLATVHPQTGEVYEPVLRASLRHGPYISSIEPADYEKPLDVIVKHTDYLLKRLNEGILQNN